jgi:putative peptidoglycan lipid II flippase
MDDKPQSILKSAFGFLSGTSFSRVTGLIRDMSTAFCFGADPAIAAFIVAYRFASLLRRIFGEGALLTSFIPHFESHRAESPKEAAKFFRDLFFSLTLVLVILIGCLEIGLYSWLSLGEFSVSNRQILILTMIMLPSVLFLCLYGLCSGLLQCEKRYFLAGVAPAGTNLIWIAAIWLFRDLPPDQAVIPLSLSIVFACAFQWLITAPSALSSLLKIMSWKELMAGNILSTPIMSMLGSISLGIIGVSATQVNSAIDTIFSRYSSLQGPAYLNYAIHLEQLPLALFGIAIASAILPPLSRAIKQQERTKFRELLEFALSKTMLLIIPCCVAIFVLGAASINLIYGRGDFDSETTMQTIWCLWGYGLGLLPMAIGLLLSPAFFAQKDFWTPTLGSLYSVAINVFMNTLFVIIWGWGPASLAVSTSLSALFNTLYLFRKLSKKSEIHLGFFLLKSSWKVIVVSIIAGVMTLYAGQNYLQDPTLALILDHSTVVFERNFMSQLSHFFMLLGVLLFMLLFGMGVAYQDEVRRFFKRQTQKAELE